MPRRTLVPILCLALLPAAPAGAARLRVCTFSFHTPREIDVFKNLLPAEDFDVVDLSPPPALALNPDTRVRAASDRGSATGWLPTLCREDLRCDVVVYSAEFAGRFFGASGTSIGLQELEEASCRRRCDGLFHSPREVFLLACNTLATKDQDRRTPEQYLQILLAHGFDRATAERVVAYRYGPLGPSFREALRRIFAGVPRIYGFSSVAPLGDVTAPLLEKYFRAKGDYRRYLEHAQRDTAPNKELLSAFAGTDLVQTTGLTASEPAMADRRRICTIYDEREPTASRLRLIRELAARDDFPSFIPSVQVFIDRHPPSEMRGAERALFKDIQGSAKARDQVLGLVHQLDVSALQLELAHFAVHMGWMTQDELRHLALDSARQLLIRPPSSEVVDIMCEIPKHEPIGDRFGADDVPGLLYLDADGVRLIDCLSPTDPRVSARLARGLDSADELLRLWSAYALSRRLPLDDAVLVELAGHLRDPSPDLRLRLRWILTVQKPLSDEVHEAIAAHDPNLAAELRPRASRRRRFFW